MAHPAQPHYGRPPQSAYGYPMQNASPGYPQGPPQQQEPQRFYAARPQGMKYRCNLHLTTFLLFFLPLFCGFFRGGFLLLLFLQRFKVLPLMINT